MDVIAGKPEAAATFVERARAKHGDRFDYSTSQWLGFQKPISVVCRKHGAFTTTPKYHLANPSGSCPQCRAKRFRLARSLNTDQFIQRAREVHGNRYDYHLVQYTGTLDPVVIVCREHGPFRMKPYRHLSGRGCRKCTFRRHRKERRLPFWEFVERVISVHGANRYEYELKDFVNMHSKIPIHCPKHGRFLQTLANHLKGTGCPSCVQSAGEQRIRESLQMLDVECVEQACFNKCRNRRPLRFDFYVPSHRLLIEFDGRQHYENSKLWGGEEELAEIQRRDAIKNRFAERHGYRLLRIPFYEYENIETILLDELTTTVPKHKGGNCHGTSDLCTAG